MGNSQLTIAKVNPDIEFNRLDILLSAEPINRLTRHRYILMTGRGLAVRALPLHP